MSYVHLILDDGLIAHKVKQHWTRRIIPFKPINFWSCKNTAEFKNSRISVLK